MVILGGWVFLMSEVRLYSVPFAYFLDPPIPSVAMVLFFFITLKPSVE